MDQVVTNMKDRIVKINMPKNIDFDAIEQETLNAQRLDLDHEKRVALFKLSYLVYLFARGDSHPMQAHAVTLLQDNVEEVDPWLLEMIILASHTNKSHLESLTGESLEEICEGEILRHWALFSDKFRHIYRKEIYKD